MIIMRQETLQIKLALHNNWSWCKLFFLLWDPQKLHKKVQWAFRNFRNIWDYLEQKDPSRCFESLLRKTCFSSLIRNRASHCLLLNKFLKENDVTLNLCRMTDWSVQNIPSQVFCWAVFEYFKIVPSYK